MGTNLVLPTAHLPALVLLALSHILEKQPPASLLGVLTAFYQGVWPRVAGGEAEFCVVIAGTSGGIFNAKGGRGGYGRGLSTALLVLLLLLPGEGVEVVGVAGRERLRD